MSLRIDVDRVIGVLLADGWHRVVRLGGGEVGSFCLGAYEFVADDLTFVGGGAGVAATGARWIEAAEPFGAELTGEVEVFCPLTAILAVVVDA